MDIKELQVSTGADTKQNHPWEYARSKVVCSLLKNYLKKSPKEIAVDIGCGDVFFLRRFADKYPEYELVAVDIAFDDEIISALAAKNSKYNIRLFNSIQNVTDIRDASIIFLLDVIEHIEDDIAFLKDVVSQAYISPQTVIIVTVPAFNSLYCDHDRWLGHFRRYSHTLLKQHAEKAGLSYLDGGYFFSSLLFPRFVQKIIEKIRKNQTTRNQGIGNYKGGKVLTFLYENFLWMDFCFFRIFKFLGMRIPGLSAYIICKKQIK